MKISSAGIMTTVEHALTRTVMRNESVRAWVDGAAGQHGGPTPTAGSAAGLRRDASADRDLVAPDLPAAERARVLLLDALLKAVFGGEVSVVVERSDSPHGGGADAKMVRAARVEDAASGAARQGWGLEYDSRVSSEESETLRFAAHGIVRTADGREVSFQAQLELSRVFLTRAGVSLRAGDARFSDPLVINYAGPAVDLGGGRLAFDLDADGALEQIPAVKAGSGFLAIDLDGDGVVSSGRELFGPSTGDAFAELVAHDVDGNGWIDAGDPTYGRLRLWTPGLAAAGGARSAGGANGQLTMLAQVGIGAISVSGVEAPFSVRGRANEPLGQNTRIGVFIREDGSAGTIQQIDLAV